MPYCPKCDMEFIDGITVCSDCGGPLTDSKETADKQKLEEKKQQELEYAKMLAAQAEEAGDIDALARPRQIARTPVYMKKSEQYADMKSSASAFLIVGGILFAGGILSWCRIVPLPLTGTSGTIMQTALTLFGLLCLLLAFSTLKSAKKISSEVQEEEDATASLIDWFVSNHTAASVDAQIEGSAELSPEELSLKRFALIQDILITSHDLTDQSYVDALGEDIYSRLYEDNV